MKFAKYKVEVKVLSKALPIDKEVSDEFKGIGSRVFSRMRKEAVECPVEARIVPFLKCFTCRNYIRRVRGIVDCKGSL